MAEMTDSRKSCDKNVIHLRYFSWVRETIGKQEEKCDLPESVESLKDLITHLSGLDACYAQAFKQSHKLRYAINQCFAELDAPVNSEDEIAFFPPVTGG